MNSKITMQEIFFFLILIALSVGFYNIIYPFITDIFLTIVLVILFKKPHAFFMKRTKNKKSRASMLTIFSVIFTVLIPLIFIGVMITNEASSNYEIVKEKLPEIQQQMTQENIRKHVDNIPVLNKIVENINIEDYRGKINEGLASITKYTVYLIQNTFTGISIMIVHSFIILFLMYYMLIDGNQLINRIRYLIPLKDTDEKKLLDNIEKVTDAIVINSFMIGVIEGTYGGVLFAILGIPSPFFWGFIMAMLSIIPLVGTNAVLVPMTIFQFIIGNTGTATVLLILGIGVVIINQNIIRPRLDGSKSGMHTAIVFVASLGGLMWLGIVGFLAGPLLMALFISMINIFGEKYKNKLEKFNNEE